MVGAPGSTTLVPPMGPDVDVSYRCWSALPDLQLRHLPGARRRHFLALMVDAPGSPAPTPPRGLTVDVS
jgi:hypothetical protein